MPEQGRRCQNNDQLLSKQKVFRTWSFIITGLTTCDRDGFLDACYSTMKKQDLEYCSYLKEDELIEETVVNSTGREIFSRQLGDRWKSHKSPGVTGFQKS